MSKPTIADLPVRYQEQARAQLAGVPHPKTAHLAFPDAPAVVKVKPRIRQNAAGLNKTEQAFFDYMRSQRPCDRVLSQSITLRLGNGVRYTPDFIRIIDATNEHERTVSEIYAYEVKGFMRDDAAVKLKVAASLYPWIRFHLVTKRKGAGGEWDIQEVLA